MLTGGRIAKLATVSILAAVPLPGQVPAPPAATAEEDEIVVIARKLRKVRLNYASRGQWVTKCEADVSSGDPRIDRIMCAIVKACVREGNREAKGTQACVAAKIDQLAEGAPGPVEVAAAPPSSSSPRSTPRQAPRPDGPDIVVTARNEPDIVVTGPDPTMRGGLWEFRRTGTPAGGDVGFGQHFTQCLPPGAIAAMLRRAAGEDRPRLLRDRCGGLRLRLADGRITGRRSCSWNGPDPNNPGKTISGGNNLTLTGSYDSRRLTLRYRVEEDFDGLERASGPAWNPKRPVFYQWQVTALRKGECPLRERRDQLNDAEVGEALFGVKDAP